MASASVPQTDEETAPMRGLGDLNLPGSANFPRDADGRVYHLSVKEGQVANRVLCVGSASRAKIISGFLDDIELHHCSHRGFHIYTGTFKNTRVSIVATGMGIPMTDFSIRETRAVVKGPMVYIRLGTCGSPATDVPVGSLAVATAGSVEILRNPDAFALPREPGQPALGSMGDATSPYHLTKPVPCDKELGGLLVEKLTAAASKNGTTTVVEGLNATACSFYSSQGRVDPMFDDRNSTLVDELMGKHPNTVTIEMESFHMMDLARMGLGIRAAACTIVLAQRKSDEFLTFARLAELEALAGKAALEALVQATL